MKASLEYRCHQRAKWWAHRDSLWCWIFFTIIRTDDPVLRIIFNFRNVLIKLNAPITLWEKIDSSCSNLIDCFILPDQCSGNSCVWLLLLASLNKGNEYLNRASIPFRYSCLNLDVVDVTHRLWCSILWLIVEGTVATLLASWYGHYPVMVPAIQAFFERSRHRKSFFF